MRYIATAVVAVTIAIATAVAIAIGIAVIVAVAVLIKVKIRVLDCESRSGRVIIGRLSRDWEETIGSEAFALGARSIVESAPFTSDVITPPQLLVKLSTIRCDGVAWGGLLRGKR